MVRNSDLAHDPTVADSGLSQALCPGRRRNCATWRPPAAICRSVPAAITSAIPPTPVTNVNRAAGCAAIDGYNRIHAVLGGSDQCIATHPSDMAVAMVALDAVVHIQGRRWRAHGSGGRVHLLPGDTPHLETVVQPGELITYVTVPKSSFAAHSAYVKLRDRASYEFALASAAAALERGQSHSCCPLGPRRRRHQALACAGSRARAERRNGR